MEHSMKLRRRPFEYMRSGRKTIELRLYDEKRRKIKVGDVIRFDLADGNESFTVEVVGVYPFENFKALYENLPLEKCGYDDPSMAKWQDMEEYYSQEEQTQFGVVGIEVKRI